MEKQKEVLRVLLRHYTKIGINGGIAKVIYDDEFEDIAEEIVKLFTTPVVVPRYFIDERAGCAAVRDREHPKYNKDYQGLHRDTPDVAVYAHGKQNHKKGYWEMKDTDINYLKLECDRLNRSNGA